MIPFHRVLITAGIVFCAGFALWALGQYITARQLGMLLLTVTFAVLALGLTYYLIHLKRFLGR
jgi:hypothetical protein